MDRRDLLTLISKLSTGIVSLPFLSCNSEKIFTEDYKYYEDVMSCVAENAETIGSYIFYNNDGNDFSNTSFTIDEISPETFLEGRLNQLIGTNVNYISYCTGRFNVHSHRSEIAELYKPEIYSKLHKDYFTDPLELAVDFGKNHNKKVFWSLRMNDIHDSYKTELLSNWKLKNTHLLMGRATDHKYADHWSACNYENDEIRDIMIRLVEEVLSNYDVDGIELDFFRHPVFFKEQLLGENVKDYQRTLMSEFVYNIKELALKWGAKRRKEIKLAVRVPDSLGYSMALGLDLDYWLCNKLVDVVIAAGYFQLEPWSNLKVLSDNYGVPFVPCISLSRYQRDLNVKGYFFDQILNEIAFLKNIGIKNFYFFNFFPHEVYGNRLPSIISNLQNIDSTPSYKRVIGGEIDFWLRGGSAYLKY